MAEPDEFEKMVEKQIAIEQGRTERSPRHGNYVLAFKQALVWYRDFKMKPKYQRTFPRQDSTAAQLRDVMAVANKMGCYDAADAIERLINFKEGK